MNLLRPALVACSLLAMISPASATDSAQDTVMPGSYSSTNVKSADVQDAKSAIQKEFTNLRIDNVQAAFVQVVAGLNFKLICRVGGDNGPATWQFVIWHRLDNRWQLTSADQISN